VILVDTSAWIEFLRATGSAADLRLRDLIEQGADLCTTEVVVMELVAGAGTDEQAAALRRLLARFELVAAEGLADYEAAAELFRACRRRGETVRSLTDCLVAAVALRAGASVLHRDRDFEVIARHSRLRTA
jgi:predicted nucleic acid-binding protein